jgi:hypothetical protein
VPVKRGKVIERIELPMKQPALTKRGRIYVVAFVIVAGLLIWYFFGLYWFPGIPEAIVPPSAQRIEPPPGEELYHYSASAAMWTEELYYVEDMSVEEVVHFYEKRFFKCEPRSRTDNLIYPYLDKTYWNCKRRIRYAEGMAVSFSTDPEGNNRRVNIYVKVSITPP